MSAAIAGSEVAITVESMFSMNKATATISGTNRSRLMPKASRHRNFADVLRHLVAPLRRRALGDRHVPALHVGILVHVDRLPFESRDPRPDRDVGDRIGVGHELSVGQPAVEHAIEPMRLLEVALLSVRRFSL